MLEEEVGIALAVIPARLRSVRIPQKPLLMIAGVPMVVRVAERVLRARTVRTVVVATDADEVIEVVKASGLPVRTVRTSPTCRNGTERVVETVRGWSTRGDPDRSDQAYPVVVNVQGDEPRVDPDHIDAVVKVLRDHRASVGTLAVPVTQPQELDDPNVVKCVVNHENFAMYFSRARVPHRGHMENPKGYYPYLRHVGLYSFRWDLLMNRISSTEPCRLEEMECLEQLGWMYRGEKVKVHISPLAHRGVDTIQDLAATRAWFQEHPNHFDRPSGW